MVSLGTSSVYDYDGDGLNVVRHTAGGDTIYIFSGTKVIAEYAAGSQVASPAAEYIYAGAMVAVLDGSGNPTFRHYDHLSARLDTDANGNVVRQFGHYPFGEVWYETGTVSKWKFTTYERDSTLDYALARHYAFTDARFVSPDPLGGDPSLPQSLDRYAYVRNDPINATDPLGLFCGSTGCPDDEDDDPLFNSNCTPVGPQGDQHSVCFVPTDSPYCVEMYIDGTDQGTSCARTFRFIWNPWQPAGNNEINTKPPTPAAPPVTFTCKGTATYSAIGPNQAVGPGALAPQVLPVSGTVAIGGPRTFGIGKGGLRTFGPYITISPSGLDPLLSATGGPAPPYTVGDIGDVNVRNAPSTRFDIYRFSTEEGALNFGVRTAPTTIIVPAITGAHCPAGFTKVP